MDNRSPDELINAFGEAAREALAQGRPVPLPGIGQLQVRHEPSRTQQTRDGTRRLLPPHDHVVFEPEDHS